jgi:single-strand DNA-binding protein
MDMFGGRRGFTGARWNVTTIQIYGRLYRAPEKRTTGAGKPMTTAGLVVELGRGVEMPEWISLVAFGRIGEVLARHAKGDMVAVGGRLSKSSWTAQDGSVHTGFSVLIDSIASARTVRPGKASRARRERADEFNDAIPF